jgi:hypothetical protein
MSAHDVTERWNHNDKYIVLNLVDEIVLFLTDAKN